MGRPGRKVTAGQPNRESSTTDTTAPETSATAAASSWTGPGFSELPASGIAVAEDGGLVLHDYDGNELARARTPAANQLSRGPERLLAAVRPGDTIDAVPADRSDAPPGCESAATAGGVRVALCGGEAQRRQRVESISPTGDQRVLAVAPQGSYGRGSWRSAMPSPDGRWVLATWSGECEIPTAFLLPATGDEPAITVDGRAAFAGAAESVGIGWAPDGRAIVQLGTGLCGSAADQPGVHLVEPGSLDRRLVIRQPEPGPSVHLWRVRTYGNDAEWIFSSAIEQLGIEGCCGEPSHGGRGVTAGARWDGYDIPVGATPPGATDAVPFNDLVLSSKPIELDGAPVVAGEADLGPFVAYSCGERIWTFGGAGSGDRPTASAVKRLAATVLPYLGCTVGGRPLATGHGPVS